MININRRLVVGTYIPIAWPGVAAAQAPRNDPNTVNAFRTDCRRELAKIQTAWRTLNCTTAKGVLIVGPSHSRIPRLVE